jgi:rubredoxin
MELFKYVCLVCGYTYDPEFGDDKGLIPPGTPGEDLPPEWCCPTCGGTQRNFARWDEDD